MYQICSTSLKFPVLMCKHSMTALISVFSHCSLLWSNHRYIVLNTVPQGTVYHFLLPVLIIPGRRKISNICIKLMWELKHNSVLWLFHCSSQSSADIFLLASVAVQGFLCLSYFTESFAHPSILWKVERQFWSTRVCCEYWHLEIICSLIKDCL